MSALIARAALDAEKKTGNPAEISCWTKGTTRASCCDKGLDSITNAAGFGQLFSIRNIVWDI